MNSNMTAEIDTAVNFFACLLMRAKFSPQCRAAFSTVLSVLLKKHYEDHWYPDEPMKGSGYRCLRMNGVMHPILVQAVKNCRFPMKKFRSAFPSDLTIWVDPNNVGVRFGEDGSIGLLYPNEKTVEKTITKWKDIVPAERVSSVRTLDDKTAESTNGKNWNISPPENPETKINFRPIRSDHDDNIEIECPNIKKD